MAVYVLTKAYPYEGESVLCVAESTAAAQKFAYDLEEADAKRHNEPMPSLVWKWADNGTDSSALLDSYGMSYFVTRFDILSESEVGLDA